MLATAVTLSSCSWAHHEVQRALFDRHDSRGRSGAFERARFHPSSLPPMGETNKTALPPPLQPPKKKSSSRVRPSVRPSRDSFPFPLLLLLRTDGGRTEERVYIGALRSAVPSFGRRERSGLNRYERRYQSLKMK